MSGGLGKDERGARNFDGKHKLRHKEAGRIAGPDVIVKTRDNGDKVVDPEDLLGLPHSNVAYSLNKDRRWQKVEGVVGILEQDTSDAPISFISTAVPRETGRDLFPDHMPHQLSAVSKHKGGVTQYVESSGDGFVVEKNAKSGKAHLESLINQPDPGPYSRRERRMMREDEARRKMEDTLETQDEEKKEEKRDGVQYTAMRLHEASASEREGAWRRQQRTTQGLRHHKQRTGNRVLENRDDWEDDDWEGDLNDELDEMTMPQDNSGDEKSLTEEPKKIKKEEHQTTPAIPPLLVKHWLKLLTPRPEMEVFEDVEKQIRAHLTDSSRKVFLKVHPTTCFPNQNAIGMGKKEDAVMVRDIGGGRVACYSAPSFQTRGQYLTCCDGYSFQQPYGGVFGETTASFIIPEPCPKACPHCGWSTVEDAGPASGEPTEQLSSSSSPGEDAFRRCSGEPRRQMLALFCGHFACSECWIQWIRECSEQPRITTCIDKSCSEKLRISAAAVILSDKGVNAYSQLVWHLQPKQEGAFRCWNCPGVATVALGYHKLFSFCCACEIRTCSHCESPLHQPLSCADYANWLQLLRVNFLDPVDSTDRQCKSSLRHISLPPMRNIEEECAQCKHKEMKECPINDRKFCANCGTGLVIKHSKFPKLADLAKALKLRLDFASRKKTPPQKYCHGREEKYLTEVIFNIEAHIVACVNFASMKRVSGPQLNALNNETKELERKAFLLFGYNNLDFWKNEVTVHTLMRELRRKYENERFQAVS